MTENNNVVRNKILAGLELTYERLVKSKQEMGFQFVVSDRQGKVIHLKARELNY